MLNLNFFILCMSFQILKLCTYNPIIRVYALGYAFEIIWYIHEQWPALAFHLFISLTQVMHSSYENHGPLDWTNLCGFGINARNNVEVLSGRFGSRLGLIVIVLNTQVW